jgi:beta-glucosidase
MLTACAVSLVIVSAAGPASAAPSPRSVMCAYPRINGTFNCEHAQLLTQILKKEWGFDGFVFSD